MIGADSLGYLPKERLCDLGGNRDYCSACFDGGYPTSVEKNMAKSKFEQRISENRDR